MIEEPQDSKSESERELSDRQRYWLTHLRAAESLGEPLKTYAKRLGLSEHSLYAAKRRLRVKGVIAPASPGKASPARFARVTVARSAAANVPPIASTFFRVRLSSGAVLEWSAAPQGDALRELLGLVS